VAANERDRRVRLAAVLAVISALAAASAAQARPGGFGCVWPVDNLPELPQGSRYYGDHTERVFRLAVYLNMPMPPGAEGVSIGRGSPGPRKVGICKIVLPNLESLRRRVVWRDTPESDSGVYPAIGIQQAGAGGAMFTDWILLRPRSTTVTGKAIVEFTVDTGYSSNAQ
jgi:hypothetical protein